MSDENTLVPSVISESSFDIASLNLNEANAYVTIAPTGTTVTPFPFERIKFEASRQLRFSILTSKVAIVKRHYHTDLGYFLCNNGVCCQLSEKSPSVVYLYPIVQYMDCSDRGKPLSDRIQVRMLQCNKDMYSTLTGIQDAKGDLTQFDFCGTLLPGNDRFPKTQLIEVGNAIWRNNEKANEYIKDYMTRNGDKFISSVGKIYSDDKLRELLSEPTTDTVAQDIDDIFAPQGHI